MPSRLAAALVLAFACTQRVPPKPTPTSPDPGGAVPLAIGETFRLDSRVLGQQRVINVYLPPGYAEGKGRFPVLYALDGGIKEDFPHVVGHIDVSIKNAVIWPMIVVGIENIERRHDLAGP